MYKGDISNDIAKRVLVSIEPLLIEETLEEKKRIIFKTKTTKIYYDKLLLNKFYLYAMRGNLNLELISFKHDDDELERMFNEMDRTGINPFRYWQTYKSPSKLAKDLPYRPEVIGVIDIPENRLMYGHWALDF
jgi:hypothetical protein